MDKLFTALPPEKGEIVAKMDDLMKKFIVGELDLSISKVEEWKGYRFLPAFSPAVTKRVYDEMKVEKDTVFIGSYPKTGTNWFAEIVKEILYGHDENQCQLSKMIPMALQMLEVWIPEKIDLYEHIALPRKIFTTHLPEELVNFEKIKKSKAKAIIVYRNPKDQAVSWYHFTQKNPTFDVIRDQISSDWNQFILDYIQGKHPTISREGEWYPDYLLGWNKHKGDENLMFACFEDMKKDPQAEIIKLAKFLDVKLNEERASEIALSTAFSTMKAIQDSSDDDLNKQVWKKVGMVRKGQVGSWKDTFTDAQSKLMDKAIEEKLSGSGIEFKYEL